MPLPKLAIVVIAGLLAACAAKPPVAPAPQVYRDVSRPIGAAALFGFNQLQGGWEVLARYPMPSTSCVVMRFEVQQSQASLLCMDDPSGARLLRQGPVQSAGTGRILLDFGDDFEARDLRVIWIAHDGDTVVLGAADGRAAFVLNRRATLSADRWMAVREMLDFNGFNTAALVGR